MVIDKIVLKNVHNFDQWDREIDEHFDSQYRRIEMNDVERERIFYQTNDLLMSIANNFFYMENLKTIGILQDAISMYLVKIYFLNLKRWISPFSGDLIKITFTYKLSLFTRKT